MLWVFWLRYDFEIHHLHLHQYTHYFNFKLSSEATYGLAGVGFILNLVSLMVALLVELMVALRVTLMVAMIVALIMALMLAFMLFFILALMLA